LLSFLHWSLAFTIDSAYDGRRRAVASGASGATHLDARRLRLWVFFGVGGHCGFWLSLTGFLSRSAPDGSRPVFVLSIGGFFVSRFSGVCCRLMFVEPDTRLPIPSFQFGSTACQSAAPNGLGGFFFSGMLPPSRETACEPATIS
jgi:hypothetical protein